MHSVSFVEPASMAESSPMDLVFPMEAEEPKAAPLPHHMTAAAAADTLYQLERLLLPENETEMMVRLHAIVAACMHLALGPSVAQSAQGCAGHCLNIPTHETSQIGAAPAEAKATGISTAAAAA